MALPFFHQLLLPGWHCCSNCDRHDVHLQIIYFGRQVRRSEALTDASGWWRLSPVGSQVHFPTKAHTHHTPPAVSNLHAALPCAKARRAGVPHLQLGSSARQWQQWQQEQTASQAEA